jgi:hypothetical protein
VQKKLIFFKHPALLGQVKSQGHADDVAKIVTLGETLQAIFKVGLPAATAARAGTTETHTGGRCCQTTLGKKKR